MPSAPRRRSCSAAAGILAVLLAGCGHLDDPAVAQGVTRADLVTELANQLSHSTDRTYEAIYQLSGGATGTIAHETGPARTAYRYPGGMLLVTPSGATRCAGATCTPVTVPPSGVPAPLLAHAHRAGLATPVAVLGLLTAASLDADVTVEQHDTTIAGHHATCVDLANVDEAFTGRLSACITNEGALGSFTGTLDNTAIDMAMTHYANQPHPTAYVTPNTSPS